MAERIPSPDHDSSTNGRASHQHVQKPHTHQHVQKQHTPIILPKATQISQEIFLNLNQLPRQLASHGCYKLLNNDLNRRGRLLKKGSSKLVCVFFFN